MAILNKPVTMFLGIVLNSINKLIDEFHEQDCHSVIFLVYYVTAYKCVHRHGDYCMIVSIIGP